MRPSASLLLDEQRFASLRPKTRNLSLLIHGYRAPSAGKDRALGELLERIDELNFEDQPENPSRLEAARFSFPEGKQRADPPRRVN